MLGEVPAASRAQQPVKEERRERIFKLYAKHVFVNNLCDGAQSPNRFMKLSDRDMPPLIRP
jgi:hypothetical protein